MKTFKTNAELRAEVDAQYDARFAAVRNDPGRTADWKKAQIAKLHRAHTADLNAKVQARDSEQRARQRQLESRVFGPDAGQLDFGAGSISRRDAGDRAAQLETPAQALDLLARAERSGDEPLARAIAERAYEQANNPLRAMLGSQNDGWTDVANQFLETRPQLGETFAELWQQTQPDLQSQIIDGAYLYSQPAELAGLSDQAVDRLAESA